jgi:hypothetical protein
VATVTSRDLGENFRRVSSDITKVVTWFSATPQSWNPLKRSVAS